MSCLTSVVGGSPACRGIAGFLARSFVGVGLTDAVPPVASAGVELVSAGWLWAGSAAGGGGSFLSSPEPQPAAPSAARGAGRRGGRRIAGGGQGAPKAA